MSRLRVAVVGGGLAGISAALAAADRGMAVTVFERRRSLGGRTWSFERGGLSFDNGQHVFMRCCTRYLALLDRIGARDLVHLQDRLDVAVVAPGGAVHHLRRSRLPAPLQLGPALVRYGHLSVRERAQVARVSLALRRLDLGDPTLDDRSFGDWLRARGVGSAAVEGVWDVICRPTVNLPAADASLALAAKVFKTGLLEHNAAADIGWSAVPLGRLHGEIPSAALDAAGVELRLEARVEAIDGPTVRVDGAWIDFDAVVVAVTPDAAARLVPRAGVDEAGLGSSPIVNVHVVYDRAVTDLPFAAGLHTPVEYVFDRSDSAGVPAGWQCLAVSLSAAEQWIGEPVADLTERFVDELARLFPAAGSARVVETLVTREHRATFRGGPGTARRRPGPATAEPGVFLAGDWTDTGWPATMEGAVRSGEAAVGAVVSELGAGPAHAATRLATTDRAADGADTRAIA